MDPSTVLLIGSHVATLVAGVLFGRWLVVRNLEVGERDGHVTFEVKHHDCPPHDD